MRVRNPKIVIGKGSKTQKEILLYKKFQNTKENFKSWSKNTLKKKNLKKNSFFGFRPLNNFYFEKQAPLRKPRQLNFSMLKPALGFFEICLRTRPKFEHGKIFLPKNHHSP